MKSVVFFCLTISSLAAFSLIVPQKTFAGFLFHATRKAAAKSIMREGISPSKFRPGNRFGKGFYASKRKITALKERPKADALIRLRTSKNLKRRSINLTRPSKSLLKKLVGAKYDMRGKVKKGVIGPKLGKKLGQVADRRGKAIEFKSSKNGWTNVFIPKSLFKKHRRIVSPKATSVLKP